MKVDVLNMQGSAVDSIELPAEIFEAPVNEDLMHQAYVRQMANARQGTHETKTRHEVRGGGKKPFKQKGTGNARQGSRRSAQWVGGGKIHTPHMRDYTLAMPRKMRRGALRSALTVKASANQIVVVDQLTMSTPKTKDMLNTLKALGVADLRTLVLLAGDNDNVEKSIANLEKATYLRASYLNIRDLLSFERLLMPLDALEVIKSNLGQEA
jgi:large subunit ribosomal protein L4